MPYNIANWLEKNKDPLNDTVVDLFKKGTNDLVQFIFADHPGQSGGGDDSKGTLVTKMRTLKILQIEFAILILQKIFATNR